MMMIMVIEIMLFHVLIMHVFNKLEIEITVKKNSH